MHHILFLETDKSGEINLQCTFNGLKEKTTKIMKHGSSEKQLKIMPDKTFFLTLRALKGN